MRTTTANIEFISNGSVTTQGKSKVFKPNKAELAEKVGNIATELVAEYFDMTEPLNEGDKFNVTITIEPVGSKKK